MPVLIVQLGKLTVDTGARLCQREPRDHDVYRDVEGAEILGELVGQALDAGLGRAVRYSRAHRPERAERAAHRGG